MGRLTPLLSSYIGDVCLHQRCAYHILNLIVKCGLKRLQHYLESLKTAISFSTLLTSELLNIRLIALLWGYVLVSFGWMWM
jgi:hypothetical protein